ncbi:MAG: patatin-like phospholipase family protein [Desulfatibacillaceae bacterium]
MADKERTAFVFAGGGSLGAIQVGMLQALTEAGYVADMVVGASVGAINCAFYAGEPNAGGVRALRDVWSSINRRDVFPVSPINSLLAFFARRNSFVDSTALRSLVRNNLSHPNLEDAEVDTHVVATDILTGQEVCISEGDAVRALMASAAIPAVFPPVTVGDSILVDGGVSNMTPISTAVEKGAHRVVILHTGFTCATEKAPKSVIAMGMHVMNLMVSRRLSMDVRLLRDKVDFRVPPRLCPITASPFDFSQTDSLVERARQATGEWLEDGGMEEPPADVAARLEHKH